MKKKTALFIISYVLILALLTAFVGCDKEDNKPTPIQLTEDMTAEEVLNLLQNTQNLTYEFYSVNYKGDDYICTMKISDDGYIQTYYINDFEKTYVVYIQGEIATCIYIGQDNKFKDFEAIADEDIEMYKVCNYIEDIKLYFETADAWKIEDGSIIFNLSGVGDGGEQNATAIYKDFNCTEMDFDYYLSMDIPLYS